MVDTIIQGTVTTPDIKFLFNLCAEETHICSNWNGESNRHVQKAVSFGDKKGNAAKKGTKGKYEINSSLQNYIWNTEFY